MVLFVFQYFLNLHFLFLTSFSLMRALQIKRSNSVYYRLKLDHKQGHVIFTRDRLSFVCFSLGMVSRWFSSLSRSAVILPSPPCVLLVLQTQKRTTQKHSSSESQVAWIKLQYLGVSEVIFISLIRMRSKRDIKMGRLCTPGGAVLGIVGGGCDVPFFKW